MRITLLHSAKFYEVQLVPARQESRSRVCYWHCCNKWGICFFSTWLTVPIFRCMSIFPDNQNSLVSTHWHEIEWGSFLDGLIIHNTELISLHNTAAFSNIYTTRKKFFTLGVNEFNTSSSNLVLCVYILWVGWEHEVLQLIVDCCDLLRLTPNNSRCIL